MISGLDVVKITTQGSKFDKGKIVNVFIRREGVKKLEKCRMDINQIIPLLQDAKFEEDKKLKYTHLTLA